MCRRIICACVLLSLALGLAAVPVEAEAEDTTGTAHLRATPWFVEETEGRYTAVLRVRDLTCTGEFGADRVDTTRTPRQGRRPAVVVTVFQEAPEEGVNSIVFDDFGMEAPTHRGDCGGVDVAFRIRVKLPVPWKEVALFDGSHDPPEKRLVCYPPKAFRSAASSGALSISRAVSLCPHPDSFDSALSMRSGQGWSDELAGAPARR